MTKIHNFVKAFCESPITDSRIARIHTSDFRVSWRKDKNASDEALAQSILQLARYHTQDLRAQFCGKDGQVRYWQFANNLWQITIASDEKTKAKVKGILERLRPPSYDQLSFLDQKVSRAAESAQIKNLRSEKARVARDPLFGINQFYHIAFNRYWDRTPSPVKEAAPRKTPKQLQGIRNLVVSGGGAKGAVLPGAFRALFKDAPQLMSQVENIAGSSVGAISASLLATGVSKEMLQEIGGVNYEKLLGTRPLQKSGRHLTYFIRQCIRINILTRFTAWSPKQQARFHADNPELSKRIDKNLYLPVEEAEITFEMLAYLRQIDPEHFKNLHITATQKDGELLVFNSETTPEMDIASACRASASIPFVFKPAQLTVQGEEKILYDGGVKNNVPVKIFAEKGFTPQQTMVLVFEKPLQLGATSRFDSKNPTPPYKPGWLSRIIRDYLMPFITGISMRKPNTVAKVEILDDVKKNYPHTLSFASDLKTIGFRQASQHPEKYARIGKVAMRSFLYDRSR